MMKYYIFVVFIFHTVLKLKNNCVSNQSYSNNILIYDNIMLTSLMLNNVLYSIYIYMMKY